MKGTHNLTRITFALQFVERTSVKIPNWKELTTEDSDSSYFDKNYFPQNYIDHIEELIKKGTNIIFISTHQEVREELIKRGINFYLVYPKKELKEEYIQRYIQRGSSDSFINLMRNNWNNFIEQLEDQENCTHVVLDSKEYMYNKF